MDATSPVSNNSAVKPLPVPQNQKFIMIMVVLAIIMVGTGVGWLISGKKTNSKVLSTSTSTITNSLTEAGAKDTSAFKDTATGTLQAGGIKGEGTYHLDRPGGETQTVYLTSTLIDLSPFVGKKVQIWGQTQASKFAPWFMDVGKIKVVD